MCVAVTRAAHARSKPVRPRPAYRPNKSVIGLQMQFSGTVGRTFSINPSRPRRVCERLATKTHVVERPHRYLFFYPLARRPRIVTTTRISTSSDLRILYLSRGGETYVWTNSFLPETMGQMVRITDIRIFLCLTYNMQIYRFFLH